MSFAGIALGYELLEKGGTIRQAIEKAVITVEDDPLVKTVGYGGTPNRDGVVELDAAYMDGDDLSFGAVLAVRNIKNPILAAAMLSEKRRNIILSGSGAEEFAAQRGLDVQGMLSPEAEERWKSRDASGAGGHDTVCVIALSDAGSMAVGVSTSGLGFKDPGRIGDSPLIGSGLYADSMYGCAAATGSGEDIMKGCLSFEIVRGLKQGLSPQQACEDALFEHAEQMLKRGGPPKDMEMHVIAMDRQGRFGAATTRTHAVFPFVAATEDGVRIFLCRNDGSSITIEEAGKKWLDDPKNTED
jgi:isoaspartyl peptidase/L-asparaginase-like protein (Ntn-hydrolase superfamily)